MSVQMEASSLQEKRVMLQEMLKNVGNLRKAKSPSEQPIPVRTQPSIQHRFSIVQANYTQKVEDQWHVLQMIDSEIYALQEQSRVLKRDMQRTKQNSQDKSQAVQTQLGFQVTTQLEDIKLLKRELIQSIQKKYRTIKSQTVQVLGNQFQNEWQQVRNEIISTMQEIKSQNDRQEVARDEIVSFMVNGFGQEILKLEQAVKSEKQERSIHHNNLLQLVSQLEEQVQNSMQLERKEANTAAATLQGYLQELCMKIERQLLR